MKRRTPMNANTPSRKPANVYRRSSATNRTSRFNQPLQLACEIKSKCGACKYVNDPYEAGLSEKHQRGLAILENAKLLENCRAEAPAKSPRQLEYRSLFKLAVRPAAKEDQEHVVLQSGTEYTNRFAIGLFHPGTHQVVNMDRCPLHTFPLKRLLRDIRVELNLSELQPFNEAEGTGDIRYITARAAHLTGEIILTFVSTSLEKKNEFRRLSELLRRRDHRITSTFLNINAEVGNAIFGRETVRISGSDRLRERVCDLDFEIGPTSFFQINPWQAINLYRRVEHIAGPASGNEVAWDLFCGTGQMSLILARAGYKVLGIEENPQAVEDAENNARKNKLEAKFIAARAEDSEPLIPESHEKPSLIVVNPSRRGLAPETRKHIAKIMEQNPRSRLLYVSCEVETLARDLKDIITPGYHLRQIASFDMFPQTTNMEWLAVVTP